MIWTLTKFFAKKEVNKDVLGNSISADEEIGEYASAFTPWTTSDVELVGREITTVSRKVVTKAPLSVLRKAEKIEIDNDKYDVHNITNVSLRWRVFTVKRIGNED